MALRSAAKILHKKRSIEDLSRINATVKFGAIPDQIWVFRSPRWIRSKLSLANGNGWVVAVRSVTRWFHFIRFRYLSGVKEEQIRVYSGPVSMRHVALCITVVAGPYDIQSLFIGFPGSALSLTCDRNSNNSAKETAHLRGFFVLCVFAPMLRERKDSRGCVLAGFERCSAGGAFLLIRRTGGAGAVRCTVFGRVIILRVLV